MMCGIQSSPKHIVRDQAATDGSVAVNCGAGGVLTLRGLRPGREYRFRAQASNAVGFSAFSPLGPPIMSQVIVPDTPSAPVCMVPPTATTLKVKWTPPADTGGAVVTGYCIEREGADIAMVPAHRKQHAFSKLPPGTEQRVRERRNFC